MGVFRVFQFFGEQGLRVGVGIFRLFQQCVGISNSASLQKYTCRISIVVFKMLGRFDENVSRAVRGKSREL